MPQMHVNQLTRYGALLLSFVLLLTAAEPLAVSAKPAGKRSKTVTRTFINREPFRIVDDDAADPYPSTIGVGGFKRARITDIDLRIRSFSHGRSNDVDILLVAPDGRNAIVMSDAGSGRVVDTPLTLDDQAAAELPDQGDLVGGTFRPTNHDGVGSDEFPSPAPEFSEDVRLSTFTGANPNGRWRLFVVDDSAEFDGSFGIGWELEITARVKKKGNGKRR